MGKLNEKNTPDRDHSTSSLNLVGGLVGMASLGFGVSMGASGLAKITDYLNHANSIREAIYSKSEITPELIQHASQIVDSVSKRGFYEGVAQMVGAGLVVGAAYLSLNLHINYLNTLSQKHPEFF